MERYAVECPVCSEVIIADSDFELIEVVQEHVRDVHDAEMSEQEVQEMIREQNPSRSW
jgi:cytochrome c-type biogenesis protein CcmH/NrfF